jgi:Ion channel.
MERAEQVPLPPGDTGTSPDHIPGPRRRVCGRLVAEDPDYHSPRHGGIRRERYTEEIYRRPDPIACPPHYRLVVCASPGPGPLHRLKRIYNGFFTFVTVTILYSVLVSGRYSLDTVFGGICVYLLIGFTYGTGFYLLHTLSPGAFYPDPVPGSDQLLTFSEFLFYSFSTLTTLGYGNVMPLTSQARTMVLFEAVSGVIYVAVLIAWLVGTVTAESRKK